ncbi:hypothetical protein [Fusibacter sp. 3D3]|uniref:hypothetical protein n=1 Tax=Fusibacter sp. 3D3 TaxID=1048380 RepID=UPI000852C9DE|nr:hypothetical protein [Fusibacter sp. 3D3]GAU78402.1 hypothetical protein F3D3_3035 [Fusibacter sp. 3D3]
MKKKFVLSVMIFLVLSSFSYADSNEVDVKVEDNKILEELRGHIQNNIEISNDKESENSSTALNATSQSENQFENGAFYSKTKNEFLKLYILMGKDYIDVDIDNSNVSQIMRSAREDYVTTFQLDSGEKGFIKFNYINGEISERGSLGRDISYLEECFDDKFMENLLEKFSVKSYSVLKLVEFANDFQGLYIETDTEKIIIPMHNELSELSQYKIHEKYNAEDILNQLKKLCIENLKDSEMGGQGSALTKHTEFRYLMPISILTFFSIYIFTKKLKLRK